MVGVTGIEPVTPAVSRQCSTAELHTQLVSYHKNMLNWNIITFKAKAIIERSYEIFKLYLI